MENIKTNPISIWLLSINIIFVYMIIYGIMNDNILISILAYISMTAHYCKEWLELEKWPLWTEYCALIIGILLVYVGYQSKSLIIMLIGLIMIIGHTRQLIYNDDSYYY